MSGGSFNYLYGNDLTAHVEDLRAMAAELRQRGYDEAAEATLALIVDAPASLRSLWHAVEWHVSGDWSERQVADAWADYRSEGS